MKGALYIRRGDNYILDVARVNIIAFLRSSMDVVPVCQERIGDADIRLYRKVATQKARLMHSARRMHVARDDAHVANHDDLWRVALFFPVSL